MDLEIKVRSIHSLLQNKKFLQARNELDKLIEKIPNNSYLLNLRGLICQYFLVLLYYLVTLPCPAMPLPCLLCFVFSNV